MAVIRPHLALYPTSGGGCRAANNTHSNGPRARPSRAAITVRRQSVLGPQNPRKRWGGPFGAS